MCLGSALPRARHLLGGDVEAVKQVCGGDGQNQRRELRFVEVARDFVPNLVWQRFAVFREPSEGFGQSQSRPLRVGKEGRITPRRNGGEAFVGFSCLFEHQDAAENAAAAPVHLAGAQVNEFQGALGQITVFSGCAQRLQGGHGALNEGCRVGHSRLHGDLQGACHIAGLWPVISSDETRRKNVTMNPKDPINESFEANRSHLRGVAFRMLASLGDAEDAVQEAWLRLQRTDASEVENLRGWLTTVVARVCLDILRSRKARREESLDDALAESVADAGRGADPQLEAELADSVGVALLVVLDKLSPSERLAFVLHDSFGLPFGDIASVVGCSPDAARQLASRARRRVRGTVEMPNGDPEHQREIAQAFLAASRGGDFNALFALLDPEVVLRADAEAAPPSGFEVRGAKAVVAGATNFHHNARFSHLALVDGQAGIIVAPGGRLLLVLAFSITGEKITAVNVIADPVRLGQLDLAVLSL